MDTPKMGEFCWNELATPNLQASKDFYSKVFGWKFTDHDMGDMTYTMITKNQEKGFGGIWAIPKEKANEIPPHWMSYVLVENLDESLKKAQSNGAKVIKPADNAGDMGRFAIIADPQGAHFALWQTLETHKK